MLLPTTRCPQLLPLLVLPAMVLAVETGIAGDLAATPSAVDVLSGEELANQGVRSVTDLLGQIPAIAPGKSDAGNGAASIGLRGTTGDGTLVLIDGRRLAPGAGSGVDLNTIPVGEIERVEVLKGPAGKLYGSDAVSGVVNVITRRPQTLPQGEAYVDPTQPIDPVTPALGIYTDFMKNFTGSIDYNTLCDFGRAPAWPGTFLAPWIDGTRYTRDGFNVLIPFDQPAGANGEADAKADAERVADGTAPEVQGATDSSAPSASGTGAPPPPKTELQQWDRGVPPWSLVLRSPQVAHLLDQLKPLYDLRIEKRAEMSALNYWGLSEHELAENKADYDKARALWEGTQREILTLLRPYMDTAVVAGAQAASPGRPSSAQVPSGTGTPAGGSPGTQAGETAQQSETAGASPTMKLHVGLRGAYGDLGGGSDFMLKGSYDKLIPEKAAGQSSFNLDISTFLGNRKPSPGGGWQIEPTSGAAFTPVYPYEYTLPLPSIRGFKDPEFNSDLGSLRGFADLTGRVRYGDRRADADSWWYRSGALLPGSSYPGYDHRADIRSSLGDRFFNRATDSWDFSALKAKIEELPATQSEFGYDPLRYRIGYNLDSGMGSLTIPVPRYEAETYRIDSHGGGWSGLPDNPVKRDWAPYFSGQWSIGGKSYYNFIWPEHAKPKSNPGELFPEFSLRETDYCALEAFPANAALSFLVNGRRLDDDWFLRRIGISPDHTVAAGTPVVVAVIDSGLDYHHFDLDWGNLWRNPGEVPDNGIDDDGNGFIDDIIGWDFTADRNTPWDHDGHGTFVTGLIAANARNGFGIDGVNPQARIMVLKALNNFGHTRASWMARAIVYAVDNGARIINLSAAGPGLPVVVQDAVDYADARGVLVFVAAGNSAENIVGIGPAGLDKVITVAATGPDDARAPFSNWGEHIDIAAPGMYVMSLRARQTDFRLTSADTSYMRGSAILGGDRRYYRADGTSFAAPLVAGVASLLWSRNPALTHTEVRRMLEQSARDIDTPGRDQYTGYGLLDAAAALAIDPAYYTLAAIEGVAVALIGDRQVARVTGTADANAFAGAWIEIGQGEQPGDWRPVGKPLRQAVVNGILGDIPAGELQGTPVWTIRVITEHKDGSRREARYRLTIG